MCAAPAGVRGDSSGDSWCPHGPLSGGGDGINREVSDLKSEGPDTRSSSTINSWTILNELLELHEDHLGNQDHNTSGLI